MVTLTPMRPSSSMVVVTSFRCGTLQIVTGSDASRPAARIGNVAFFAPEMRTSPSSGTPPVICNLSIGPCCPLIRSEDFNRQRVDFATHEVTERGIDQLVARNATFAGKSLRHDSGGIMGVVR